MNVTEQIGRDNDDVRLCGTHLAAHFAQGASPGGRHDQCGWACNSEDLGFEYPGNHHHRAEQQATQQYSCHLRNGLYRHAADINRNKRQ